MKIGKKNVFLRVFYRHSFRQRVCSPSPRTETRTSRKNIVLVPLPAVPPPMLQLMDLPPEIRQIIFIDSSKKARGTLQVLKLHLLARCDNPRHTEERPPGRALCLLYVLPQSRQTGVLRAEYFERIT